MEEPDCTYHQITYAAFSWGEARRLGLLGPLGVALLRLLPRKLGTSLRGGTCYEPRLAHSSEVPIEVQREWAGTHTVLEDLGFTPTLYYVYPALGRGVENWCCELLSEDRLTRACSCVSLQPSKRGPLEALTLVSDLPAGQELVTCDFAWPLNDRPDVSRVCHPGAEVSELWQAHRDRPAFSQSAPQDEAGLWGAVQRSAKHALNYLVGRGLLIQISRAQVLAWAESNAVLESEGGYRVQHLDSDEAWWLEIEPERLRFTRGAGALVARRDDPEARVTLPTRVLPVVAVAVGEGEERFALDFEALGLVLDWLGPASAREVQRALLAWPQLFALLSIATFCLLIGVSEAMGQPGTGRPWLTPWTLVGVACLASTLGSALVRRHGCFALQGVALASFSGLAIWLGCQNEGLQWWLVAGGSLLMVAEKLIQWRRFARRSRAGSATPV